MTPLVPALTAREEEVLLLLAGGLELRGAAAAMGVTPGTAREYVKRARRRLGALTTVQAAAIVASRATRPAAGEP